MSNPSVSTTRVNKNIKLAQMNLQRSYSGAIDYFGLNKHLIYDIVMLTEPPMSVKNRPSGLPSGVQVFCTETRENRVAIVVCNPHIRATQIYSSNVVVAVEAAIGRSKLAFISAYCPPLPANINLTLNQLEGVLGKYGSRNVILSMDSNSHSTVWFDKKTDKRGRQVLKFISSNNLNLLNCVNKPTYMAPRDFGSSKSNGETMIDLTMAGEGVIGLIDEWTVSDEIFNSDHKNIEFTINSSNIELEHSTSSTNIYHIDKDSLEKFGAVMHNDYHFNEQIIQSIDTKEKMEEEIEQFTGIIQNTAAHAFKEKQIQPTTNPWWTEELQRAKEYKKKLYRKYRRVMKDNFEPLKETYKKEYWTQKKKYEDMMVKARTDSWKNFCSATQDPWCPPYKLMKRDFMKAKPVPLFQKDDGDYCLSEEENQNFMLEKFFPLADDEDEQFEVCNTSPNDVPFTNEEVHFAISRLQDKKSPGIDLINAEMIKTLHRMHGKFFAEIFNKCLELKCFPKGWKIAYAKIIPKPHKDNYDSIKSFRPISLLPVMGKIYEFLIIHRLHYHSIKSGKLSENQFGFTPGTSTSIALQTLVSHIKRIVNKKKKKNICLLISLDIEGAFDNCTWRSISQNLNQLNCPKNLVDVLASYLSERRVLIGARNTLTERYVNRGCPQGSVSGPFLWNYCINSLLKLIERFRRVHVQAFADDVVVVVNGQDITKIKIIAEQVLRKVKRWGEENQLKFNPTKTKIMWFRKRRRVELPPIIYENKKLEVEKNLKVLGIVIDNQLDFKSHVKYIVEKAEKNIYWT